MDNGFLTPPFQKVSFWGGFFRVSVVVPSQEV